MTTVRLVQPSDDPQWLDLRRALWPDCPADRHALEVQQLCASGGAVFLAEDSDGRAIGFAEVSIRRDHVEGTTETPVPYLEGWYVIPEYRRQGIGRMLVEAVEAWARRQGFTELASDSELENHGAIRAHKRLGFREVGREVHFVRTIPRQE